MLTPSDTSTSIDWASWKPQQECVLCFLITEKHILLIEKKQGFGCGKINGPGGKIDPGETALQAAIRETEEEVGLTPINPELVGILCFQFADGYAMRCQVFRANEYEGELKETPEARPFWNLLESIPFHAMWEDDRYWFSFLLERRPFQGFFHFEEDRMLSKKIEELDSLSC